MRRLLKTRFRSVLVSGSVAPVYAAGVSGLSVILGQPAVGATCAVLDGVLSVAGSPAPTTSYQWYRSDSGLLADAGTAIPGATSSSYTFTNAELMKKVWRVTTVTNSAGTATSASWKTRCVPANMVVGLGHTADAGQSNDPATAAAYSATVLYEAGTPVTYLGTTYVLMEPYAYGVTPVAGTIWAVLSTVYYIDADAGSDAAAGTSAATAWQTMLNVTKKTQSGVAGYVAAPAGTWFLFKRGTTAPISGQFQVSAASNGAFGIGVYGTGARPKWNYGIVPQAQVTSSGSIEACVWLNKTSSKIRVHNIDFDGLNQATFQLTGITGTFIVGDVVTFPTGITGTINTVYTAGGFTRICLAFPNSVTDAQNPQNGGAVTAPGGKSATASDIQQIGPFVTGSTLVDNTGITNCSAVNFTNGGLGASSNVLDETKGDHFRINTLTSNCCRMIFNGAGVGGGHGVRTRFWFNSVIDCGNPNGTSNHNGYFGSMVDSSIIGNVSKMTANFGNSALVYHGTMDTLEIAWNVFQGCRSGVGINQGDTAPVAEQMYRLHLHHNLVRDIGKFTGQSNSSLGWEITNVQDSRIHDNITINATDSAFYQDRLGGATTTQLGNTVLAHNTWWNAAVFYSKFDGSGANLVLGLTAVNSIYAGTAAVVPFTKGFSLANAQLTLNNDLFYRSDAGTVIRWNEGGTAANYASAAALSAAVPAFETAGLTGNPNFVSTAVGVENLTLASTSVALSAGSDIRRSIGYAADYQGVARGATPSLGASELSLTPSGSILLATYGDSRSELYTGGPNLYDSTARSFNGLTNAPTYVGMLPVYMEDIALTTDGGVSGESSTNWNNGARANGKTITAINAQSWDVCLIQYGINDVTNGVTTTGTRDSVATSVCSSIQALITSLLGTGRKVVWQTTHQRSAAGYGANAVLMRDCVDYINYGNGGAIAGMTAWVQAHAQFNSRLFLHDVSALINLAGATSGAYIDTQWATDGTHLNRAGSRRVAKSMSTKLRTFYAARGVQTLYRSSGANMIPAVNATYYGGETVSNCTVGTKTYGTDGNGRPYGQVTITPTGVAGFYHFELLPDVGTNGGRTPLGPTITAGDKVMARVLLTLDDGVGGAPVVNNVLQYLFISYIGGTPALQQVASSESGQGTTNHAEADIDAVYQTQPLQIATGGDSSLIGAPAGGAGMRIYFQIYFPATSTPFRVRWASPEVRKVT